MMAQTLASIPAHLLSCSNVARNGYQDSANWHKCIFDRRARKRENAYGQSVCRVASFFSNRARDYRLDGNCRHAYTRNDCSFLERYWNTPRFKPIRPRQDYAKQEGSRTSWRYQ